MAISNYDGLVARIQEILEDDSSETLAYIPTAIELAEQRLLREIDSPGFIVEAVVSTSATDRFINKPSGYRLAHEVRYVDYRDNQVKPLTKTSKSYCEDYWPEAETSTGIPKYYSDWDKTRFIIAPTPDGVYPVHISYTQKPSGLSATVSTNYYTEYVPDALLAACMVEMCAYERNYNFMQLWEQRYQMAVADIRIETKRERRDGNISPPANTSPRINSKESSS